ncbi:hypothetical protein NXU87_18955 [Candidatus Bacteroides intestinigallinarum]|jgi:hypothetical protein|uniref:hypothetical protein n=1 Tax=Bacteroides TaxID=816 RepID=UPI001F2E0372|nr:MULTISPECIES: hypothetical protein [Bacteroides]MCS3178177.1 hypothetical protein [Candidatus Bacteroides intestinigallinarum]
MMNKSLYKLIIFIGMLGLISSCSDDDSESESEYEVVDNVVTSWDIILSNYYEKTLPLSERLCIGESDKCPLSNTYISIVNYDSEYPIVIPRGVYQWYEYGRWIDRPVPASESIKEIFNSDWYATVVVLYGGEGTYNFAVRIYNPTLNKYFVTKPYQLKIWREGAEGEYKWFRSISLVNN